MHSLGCIAVCGFNRAIRLTFQDQAGVKIPCQNPWPRRQWIGVLSPDGVMPRSLVFVLLPQLFEPFTNLGFLSLGPLETLPFTAHELTVEM